jgi:hypothetical protein
LPAGANRIAASSGAGGRSSALPIQLAPRLSASYRRARSHLGAPDRPIADYPGAQQRRGFVIRERRRDRIGILLAHHREIGVAAVVVVTGEARIRAQILAAPPTIDTRPASLAQPSDSDAIAGPKARASGAASLDHTDHLMAGNDARVPGREISFRDMQVGPTYTAHADADQNFA